MWRNSHAKWNGQEPDETRRLYDEETVQQLQRENAELKQAKLGTDLLNAELVGDLASAKWRLAEAEKDAEIGAAVNRACKELPEGYFIVICLEKDAGDIQLQCPDYNLSRNDFEHEADTFGGQINAATDAAIAKGAEVGNGN